MRMQLTAEKDFNTEFYTMCKGDAPTYRNVLKNQRNLIQKLNLLVKDCAIECIPISYIEMKEKLLNEITSPENRLNRCRKCAKYITKCASLLNQCNSTEEMCTGMTQYIEECEKTCTFMKKYNDVVQERII